MLIFISSKARALIVEDDTLIAEELTDRLSRLGFAVIAAVDSAEEGIALAIRERPDLVLMDIRLKGRRTVYKPRRRSANILMCLLSM